MSKSLIPASIVATGLLMSVALAAASTVTGTIKSLNPTQRQIVLTNGQTFSVPTGWDFKAYKPGEKVTISYEMKNGAMSATKVMASK